MVTQAQIELSRRGRQHVRVDHKGHTNTKTNTYLTPRLLLEVVYGCLGCVDLDPCSNSQTSPQVIADRYYTEHGDGLAWPWYGRVFANPPYKDVGKWTKKFIGEYQIGHMHEGIYLVAASTETKWYQELLAVDSLVCHLSKRLWFDSDIGVPCKEQARFGSVLFYVGHRPERFRAYFAPLGQIR